MQGNFNPDRTSSSSNKSTRSQIRALDDATINKIAAGEVVERPASVLKELLENSADSGATKIDVSFEDGGKALIKVIDNGSGILPDELPLALQRHATSKIQKLDDIYDLHTLGFRGEALASIGAVSDLTLTSTPPNAQKGARIVSRGGVISEPTSAAPLPGTQIEIKNLFYNVPARQKFLKSTGGETMAIKRVYKNFALIHPEIALSLKQDQKQIEFHPPQDFFKRSCDVLGVATQDSFYLESSEDGFKMRAVLVHPKLNLATQQGQYIFVQGRPVQDKLIAQALIEGYRNLVMDHQFPQCVLALEVPSGFVDVNVHPAKLQVKFQQPSLVFKFINSKIKEFLAQKLENKMNPVTMSGQAFTEYLPEPYLQQELVRDAVIQYNQKVMANPLARNGRTIDTTFSESSGSDVSGSGEFGSVESVSTGTWSGLQVIGQLANTYILTQSPKGLVLIDQHAAHERVLFERLKNQNRVESQASLFEDLVELDPEQLELLTSSRWEEAFKKWGFEFHARGPTTLAVTTRPAFLSEVGLKPLIERLGEQISNLGSQGALEGVVHDLWASMSCHGAIRAGKVLSSEEMKALLNQMEEYSFSSFCPHGRPVSVQLSLYDLEKLFKRIV